MNNSTTFGVSNNTWVAAGTSFVTSFAITTAFTGNPTLGVTAGAVAAVASIVNKLADPIFAQIRNGSRQDTLHYMIRALIVIGVVSVAADKLINFKVNVLNSFALSVLFYLIGRNDQSTNNLAGRNLTMMT